MAQCISNNIVDNQFHKGFFVPSKRHIYTRFDCFEPLALLHLEAAMKSKIGSVPRVWPSVSIFAPPYRYKNQGVDRRIIYTLTESSEPPLSLQEAAAIGDVELVRSLLDKGVGVDSWDDSLKKTALQRAAMSGHKDVVELLLAKGARIDAQEGWPGGTSLDYAAENGHKEIAELLIAKGADVNATRRGYPVGNTPLHSAVRAGHKDVVELLIAKGADVNAKNDEGQTPLDIAMIRNRTNIAELLEARGADVSLHVAARVGALAKVKSLIEEVADINAKDASGQTALHYAARTRRKDIAELLIANGADVNAKNDEGQTPIDVALQRRRWNIVKDLIDAGADVTQVNADGQTLLHIAARRNQKDLVEILLDKGDDVNAGDNEGQTPLHMAAEGGHKEIIELLLARGARIDAKDHQGGKPALTALYGWSLPVTDLLLEKGADATGPHLAAYTGDLSRIQKLLEANSAGDEYKGLTLLHTAAAGGRVELVNYLIGKGLDVKASTGEDGLMPLHYAAMGNHQDVAEILIAQGAPLDAGKTTPLFVAVWAGHKDMVKFLMSKGANINKGPKTPLHRAVSWWELDMAKLLLELGADINARDEEGNTPLHWTVNEWYMTMAKYLISKGANVDARNKQGRTPLHEAAHQWYTAMAKLLIENRASVRAKDEKGQTPLALAKQNCDTETAELLRKHEAEADLWVLPRKIEGIAPSDMMKHYLLRQAQPKFEDWRAEYEQPKTPEQIAKYQRRLRERFIEAIGGLPKRTPLNPRVTGVVRRDGYRVEKVIFESQPKHFVTGALFLPDLERFQPPYPGVLEPVGHSFAAKARDIYQTVGALLALNGMAAFVFDPIDQGERGQLLSAWPKLSGTKAHTMVGVGSILLGRNTARFEIWDGMRAIDYLQSRPEIDPNRIGCAGLSGGGTQTSYLMALDGRIVAAAPACYITNFARLLSTIGPQDAEQNIYGQLAFGMDHADYIMMRAPKPTLICAATGDFFDIEGTWTSFRYAKRLYTRMGFAERVDLIEHDGQHNYHQPLREATARWMSRWLLGKDEPITEPPIKLLSEEEIQCTPQGQVMLLEGARSVYDLNRDFEKVLSKRRKKSWEETNQADLLNQIRKLAGIGKLTELPEPAVRDVGTIQRNGYWIRKIILEPEEGIYLSALMFLPEQRSRRATVLYVHEDGKSAAAKGGGPIEELVKSGKMVLTVDLRGIGETLHKDFFRTYLLGRPYVGMRAEDILVCARFLQQQQEGPVDLVAVGHVCVPALHAAALEPNLFGSIKLVRGLISWSNVIALGRSNNQLVNTVDGALKVYDLPDLAKTLGGRLTIEQPLNALGEPTKK